MNTELKKRLAQLNAQAKAGIFGEKVQENSLHYENLSLEGHNVFLQVVNDFYLVDHKTEEDKLIFGMADMFCQIIIVLYRDCKTRDEQIALSFLNGFIEDFQSVPGTCVYPQWEALAKASYALKNSNTFHNPLLSWQQSLKLIQAYNEFLNILLGYFLVAKRCALGKSHSLNVFNKTYGSKLNEFSQLTNGNDGAFYLIFRLAQPDLRNAIAHEDIWLDENTHTVKYSAGKPQKIDYEIGLVEFSMYGMVGSHLGQAYLVAIATILLIESRSLEHISQLPSHLIKLFTKQVN